MSSSMRNAVARRPHRERGQELERDRLGLLEKRKDYKLRAKDHKRKKQHLRKLRQKGAERNEDEFYFGMLSRKGAGSVLSKGRAFTGKVDGDRGNTSLDVDIARLLKTQDISYIRTVRNVVAKEVGRLKEQVVLAGGIQGGGNLSGTAATRIVFADGEEQRDELMGLSGETAPGGGDDDGDEEEEEEGEEDDFGGFDSDSDFDSDSNPTPENEQDSERAKHIKQLNQQLGRAQKKLRALARAEHQLEVQQAKMAKTATSGGKTKKGRKIMVRTRKR